jgi:hypothetical protein
VKLKTVEELAAAISVRNYLNLVLDNAGIKLPDGREESRRIKNLPGQIDAMIIASVVDVFSEKEQPLKENLNGSIEINVSKLKENLGLSEESEEKSKRGSFKRTK